MRLRNIPCMGRWRRMHLSISPRVGARARLRSTILDIAHENNHSGPHPPRPETRMGEETEPSQGRLKVLETAIPALPAGVFFLSQTNQLRAA